MGRDQRRRWFVIYMLRGNSVLPDTKSGDPEQEFELLDYLGQGAYGSVSKALHKRTGNLYAIKILKISLQTDKAAIAKEIQILKLCNNEHIVRYYGNYEKDNDLWIVLEYCHAGSIIDLINITQRKLNQQEIASILESVLEGLVYLHSNKMIHRDIKAANILLNSQGVAKLADFGVSAESLHTNAKHWSQVGSPYWMSPEVLGRSEYTNKTDIWSLGVTAVELAEGVVPNSNMKPMVAMFQLKNKPLKGFKEPEKWSQEFNSFVSDCLNTNPTLRPEAKTLLKHDFIVKNSRGQRLLAQLVQNSLSDIEQFRRGVQDDDDTENDIMKMLNASGFNTKTIVNNRTERSHNNAQKEMLQELQGGEIQENFNSSMVINDNQGSMIINNSMIVQQKSKPQPSTFLNKYINGLKHTDNEVETQKQVILKKIAEYDNNCLQELEQIYSKYRGIITQLLASGGDSGIIKEQINSKLLKTDNIKDFIINFPKYQERRKESKEFQRSDLAKKKSQFSEMAHHSTQTNDPGYTDLSQFRDAYPRGVKSQQFNQRQFKSTEKHCFNSKSIISDMQNVKYSNYPAEEARFCKNDRSNKRFIMTQPYEWTSADSRPPYHNKQPVSSTDKTNIRDMFLSDSVVKSSLVRCMGEKFGMIEANTIKHDRVAESTLYHDCEDETFKHQNSITAIRGLFGKHNQITLNQEYEGDDNSIRNVKVDPNINHFDAKGSGKSSKNEPKKKKAKRVGSSQKRPPIGKSNPKKK